MATTATPKLAPEHNECAESPRLVRALPEASSRALENPLLDPTQGRKIGSDPYDDPTQGRKIGSDPYDDPTRGR
jgi:hypothetical protein